MFDSVDYVFYIFSNLCYLLVATDRVLKFLFLIMEFSMLIEIFCFCLKKKKNRMPFWLAQPPTSVLLWFLLVTMTNLFYFIRFGPRAVGSCFHLQNQQEGSLCSKQVLKTENILCTFQPCLHCHLLR